MKISIFGLTTFLFHKETLPILYPVSYILAITIRDNIIKVDRFTYTEPFFISNLQDPTKAVLVYWKPEKLKIPIFRGYLIVYQYQYTKLSVTRSLPIILTISARLLDLYRSSLATISVKINSLQKQHNRAIKIEFQRDYFDYIYNEELERQFKKVPINKYIEPIIHYQLPERTRLQEVFYNLSKDLSPKQEVLYSNYLSRRSSESPKDKPPKDQSLYKDPFPLTYTTLYKMMNYIDSYLKEVPKSQRIFYTHPVCQSEELVLQYLQYFKNHIQTIYNISLRL
ncbi:hypothetical protein CJF32_00010762 [Rutstroemia sp. NJR-2017a WRK4]|nr:hypothetical protein CJF32_00010762 [Rutstroemia sp. NJR-2017a WRK4]